MLHHGMPEEKILYRTADRGVPLQKSRACCMHLPGKIKKLFVLAKKMLTFVGFFLNY
jgi:hypothetical protein